MYFRIVDELAERMSQLKNYFGFKGGEVFTRQHLAYARENYLKDGKIISNGIQLLFYLFEPINNYSVESNNFLLGK